jgi:hypothetical protein
MEVGLMSTSRKTEDWLGNKYVQHYNESREKIGSSEDREDWFGNKFVQHYDDSGRKTGTSEVKEDWFGNKYVQHYDDSGEKIGTSEVKEDWFGNKYVQHYDGSGEKIGTSENKEDLFGNKYVQHFDENGRKAEVSINDKGYPSISKGLFSNEVEDHFKGEGAAGGGGSAAGGVIMIAALVAICYLFAAWRSFAAQNEPILKMILEYFVPVITMIIIPINTAAKDKRLKSAGLLEGVIVAAVMSVTQLCGLELSGSLGNLLYTRIESL